MRIPHSFRKVRHGRTVALVRDDLAKRLDDLDVDGLRLEPTALRGRGPIGAVPDFLLDGSRVLARRARRGGLIRRLIPDVFCGRCRPFRELAAAQRALERGVPTAEVVAAARMRVFGPFHRGTVYTKELIGVADLQSYLASETERPDAVSLQRRRAALREVGRVVRVAHDAGLHHADLQLRNLLVRHNERPEVFLIDLDRARWFRSLSRTLRMMNLLRLKRSAAKAARSGVRITRADLLRVMKGYTEADSGATLRTYWHAPVLKRLYRMKWALSDALYRAGRAPQQSRCLFL
jgi:tRNA A-37 threonylcarbamoyl transferase component Bud32